MFKKLLPVLFCLIAPGILLAQYAKVGEGNFLGTAAGPILTDTASSWVSRYAYIYPIDELGNIKHGDTISSLELNRSAGFALQNGGNLALYVQNTSASDFTASPLIWSNSISNATLVYNQNPQTDIAATDGYHRINFNTQKFKYDSTKGKNLIFYFEWKQTAKQLGRISFYYDNKVYFTSYLDNQCKWYSGRKANDTLQNSSDAHPHLIINYPRYDKDIEVIGIYTMGKLPVPLGNPDSVMAYVRNVGKKRITSQQMELRIKGANKLADTSTFSINSMQEKFVTLSSLFPKNKGIDTVIINAVGDSNTSNNSMFTLRLDNENIYSYRDITKGPGPGGIGFNGSTGNFVARFSSNIPKYINQVTVNFAISGRAFRVAIWEQKKNKALPGKLLWQSDSLMTVAGNYILNIPKPVYVNGNFFVGVRQLSGSNVAFGYQDEYPVRPSTFFYSAPLADTNWVDFAPNAPYRFFIEPRLQADTDIAVLSCDFPKDSIDAYTTDTIAPKATIQNIGIQSLTQKFDIHCDIFFNATKVYSEIIQDTLSSGIKRQYTFPKKYVPKDFGEMRMLVYISPPGDRVIDNDTAIRKFYVGVKKDVMVQTVFEPYDLQSLNYFTDSIVPTALIKNIGFDVTGSFLTRCKILRGNTVLYNKTITLNFTKFQSQILNFPTYYCLDTGKLKVIFTTELTNDKYKLNDTQQFRVFVNKIYDLSADSIISPGLNSFNAVGKPMTITFKGGNDGLLNAFNAKYYLEIAGNFIGAPFLKDSITFTADGLTKFTKSFSKKFTPTRKGPYTAKIYCAKYTSDFIRKNDTIKFTIYSGMPYDYKTISILSIKTGDTLSVGAGPFAPSVKIQNNGFVKNIDLAPIICQIWHGNTMVYSDIKSVNLDTGLIFTMNFAQTFNPVNFGNYKLICYTNYFADLDKKNDSITSTFFVKIGKDASVLSLDTPTVNAIYSAKVTPLRVAGKLTNYGNLTIKNVKYFINVFKQNNLVYTFNSNIDSLKGKEQKSIQKNTAYIFPDSGQYKVLFYCFSSEDQNPFNDSQWVNITVEKSKDVKLTEWKNPTNGQIVLHTNGSAALMVGVKNVGTDTNTLMSGKVHFEVFSNSNGNLVFSDSTSFTALKAGKEIDLLTNNNFGFNSPGIYNLLAYQNKIDPFTENDTLKALFEVKLNNANSIKIGDIKIYPNPAKETVFIKSSIAINGVKLYNLEGKELNCNYQHSTGKLDVSNVSQGMYVLRIKNSESNYATLIQILK